MPGFASPSLASSVSVVSPLVASRAAMSQEAVSPIGGPVVGSAVLRRGLIAMRSEMLGRAMRLTHSPAAAEDLVQDTVERALKFESHYLEGTNVRAWVHQILFSVFITRCRRARRERKALG